MSGIFNDRQRAIMEKALAVKEKMLDTYDKKNLSGESISDDSARIGIELADSLERNVERTIKLELQKMKIDVDKANGASLANIFTDLHKLRMEERRRLSDEEFEETTTFNDQVFDEDLLPGELVEGDDDIDLDKYRSGKHEI